MHQRTDWEEAILGANQLCGSASELQNGDQTGIGRGNIMSQSAVLQWIGNRTATRRGNI